MSLEILSVGARTPIGLTAASAAAAARARINRLGHHPFLVDDTGELVRGAVDRLLSADLVGVERLIPLLESAISEAVGKLGQIPGVAVSALLALPEARPGFSDDDAHEVADAVSRQLGPGLRVEIIGRGHAGALHCLEVAADRIARGHAELYIIAGADSYFHGDTIDWLGECGQLVTGQVRSGFIPGEAAGALVVTSGTLKRRLGRQALARVRAVRAAVEKNPMKSGREGLGEALTAAIEGVALELRLPEEAVDAIFCDINGERYRSEEWGFAALRTGHALRDVAYEAPSDCWGDVGAASGALCSILAVQSWARSYARGPRALVWGSSEGGLRGAAILEQPGGH